MSKHFPIDRIAVPTFYTVVSEDNAHESPIGTVFAESSEHGSKGWICLGYVSKQTPLGQGIFCGFPVEQVRVATKEEVLAALKTDHPFGTGFRPSNREAMDAGFHLAMASAVGNWTSDTPSPAHGSILPVTRKEIEDFRNEAIVKHNELMSRWDKVTAEQRKAIEMALV